MFPINITEHNWLIHKINNNDILRNAHKIRGVVYDLGCGTRPYEQDILPFATSYLGVDWSNTQHAQRADIVADLNQPLLIEDGVADTVVSFQVLEHLSEPQTMINESFRILKSEGNIFLTVPFQWWIHEAPYDFFRYTRYGLEHLFNKAGFTNIQVVETTGFWTMWFLKFNYQTARLIKGPIIFQMLIRGVLIPLWWLDQSIAPILDRYWPSHGEAAGYFVTAHKP